MSASAASSAAAPVTNISGRRRRATGPLARRRRAAGLLFAVPALCLVVPLLIYPIGQAVYYSFTEWDGVTARWIGLRNYTQLIHNPEFIQVVGNNLFMLLAIPFAICIPLAMAFLISTHITGWRFFRSVYFLPTAVSWVVIGFMSVRFFVDQGILQGLLDDVGLGFIHPNMLSHLRSALVAVMITFVWSMFGTNLIIFLAGMSTIDEEIYDAARVDGAGSFTGMMKITIPLLRRFIQFTFIITLITAFTALFSLIFVMTGGGPGFATTTLEFFIYQQAFSAGNFGVGATVGVILFLAVFAVSILQLRLLRPDD